MSDTLPFESDEPSGRLPTVAIVGRPNVGKSTLFNRLLGKRRAITDSTPGVTRDAVDDECVLGGRQVRLVDTGGFRTAGAEAATRDKVRQDSSLATPLPALDEMVRERAFSVAQQADLILLVLDVDEVTPEDEALIERLRAYADRVLLVVNKVDGPEKEPSVWNFHSYGFDAVIGVSAEHRRHLDELGSAIAGRLSPAVTPFEARGGGDTDRIRIAILGKPNTGKSTLMNRLTGSERSLVSEIPGTTRDVVRGWFEYQGKQFAILDTAGIRRKNRVVSDVEYYSVNRAIGAIEDADAVFLVIDSLESVTDQDKKIAQLAVARGRGIVIAMNKWDLLEKVANRRAAMEDRVRFLFPMLEFAPIVPLSARNGTGVPELLRKTLQIWSQLNQRVDTGKLNSAMKKWNEHYSPPRGDRFAYRVLYITQIGTNPLRFVLFVNRRKGFPATWLQYLTHRIRREFGLPLVPLDIQVRES